MFLLVRHRIMVCRHNGIFYLTTMYSKEVKILKVRFQQHRSCCKMRLTYIYHIETYPALKDTKNVLRTVLKVPLGNVFLLAICCGKKYIWMRHHKHNATVL